MPRSRARGGSSAGRRRAAGLLIAAATVLVEALVLRRRGHPLAGNVIVRCRSGHLFTTLWVPGVSVKSLRLGWWRLQRCPVGRHWSLVTPVRMADLSPAQRHTAAAHRDVRLP